QVVAKRKLQPKKGERRSRYAQQTVLAAGDAVQLHRRKPEDLAKSDGEQGVVDAAAVRDEGTDHGACQPGGENGSRQAAPQAHRNLLLEQAEGIGADAQIGAVAERMQAGISERQVEA